MQYTLMHINMRMLNKRRERIQCVCVQRGDSNQISFFQKRKSSDSADCMRPYISILISIRHLNIKMVYNLILMLIQQISNVDFTKKGHSYRGQKPKSDVDTQRAGVHTHTMFLKIKEYLVYQISQRLQQEVEFLLSLDAKYYIIYAWGIHINLIRSALYLHKLLIEDLNQNGVSQYSQNQIPLEKFVKTE